VAAKDRARGKDFERWVGKALGGKRRHSGFGGGADCDDVPFAVECKAYEQLQLRTARILAVFKNNWGPKDMSKSWMVMPSGPTIMLSGEQDSMFKPEALLRDGGGNQND